MTKTNKNQLPPQSGQRFGLPLIDKGWRLIVDGLGALGTTLIAVLMLIICSDVVARNLFGASLPLVSELGALTLVMIVFLQLATTVRHGRLARTELLIDLLRNRSPRAAAILNAIFNLVGALALFAIAWSTIRILGKDFSSGEYIGVVGVLTFPTWPFRILIMLGTAVAAIQFVLQSASEIKTAFKPRKDTNK